MSKIKLYTEEQVKRAIDIADDNTDLLEYDEILSKLTPIELPSDEEITEYVLSHKYDNMFENLIEQGAKWAIGHIKQQDK